MARVRARESSPLGAVSEAVTRVASRSLHTTQAATDLSMLLRSRSFCLSGEGPLLTRVAANLQATRGSIAEDAAAWLGLGAPPEGRVAVSLGEQLGALGPYSYGFLNNVEGIAPLAAPMAERPRRGSVALVVPRRDALPEVVPLLLSRGLGISWLISVGDGDPAEVIRFLRVDPATSSVLVALGRGARAASLHAALGDKPTALLMPLGGTAARDSALLRAVARRAEAPLCEGLEEWLAYAALLDAGAAPRAAAERARARAAVVVVGAGFELVQSEAQKVRLASPIAVDSDDTDGLSRVLAQAAVDAELLVLCGPPDSVATLSPPTLRPASPTLLVDPSQPERLRALFAALATRPRGKGDDKPIAVWPDAARVSAVLADLPPPLYLGGATVSDEVLTDHDLKRLLHGYGVLVSRQAPANTATAALRILLKLALPVLVIPELPADSDGLAGWLAEEREGVQCATQAEVKRHATLLLGKHPYVVLREVLPPAPRLRLLATPERGLSPVLRLGRVTTEVERRASEYDAALLPLLRGEARELAEAVAEPQGVDPRGLCELLGQVSACASEHALTLDLILSLSAQPSVIHAAGVLKRQVPRS